jgi:hypothetical protein
MNLRRATLWAMLGMSYIFILRAVGTLSPEIFRNLIVAGVTVALSSLASLAIVIFFIRFLKEYVEEEDTLLKAVSILAIVGSSGVFLLHLQGLLRVFDVHIFPMAGGFHHYGALIPWVSSMFLLFFFIVFYGETIRREITTLKHAAFLALTGSLILAAVRTFILYHFINNGDVSWFSDLSGRTALIFMPLSAAGFLAIIYFLSSFYRELKMT